MNASDSTPVASEWMLPEVEMFINWKNGHTVVDVGKLPDDLATILLEMDTEYTSAVMA